MKVEEFFHRFANTPLPDRDKKFPTISDNYHLNKLYEDIHNFEEYMRPMRIRQHELIRMAQKIWEKLEDAAYPKKIE